VHVFGGTTIVHSLYPTPVTSTRCFLHNNNNNNKQQFTLTEANAHHS